MYVYCLLAVLVFLSGESDASRSQVRDIEKTLEPVMDTVVEERLSGLSKTDHWERERDEMASWSDASEGQLYTHVKNTCEIEKSSVDFWVAQERKEEKKETTSSLASEDKAEDAGSAGEIQEKFDEAEQAISKRIGELDEVSNVLNRHIDRVNAIFSAAHLVAVEDLISSIVMMREMSLSMRSSVDDFVDPAFTPIESAVVDDEEEEEAPSLLEMSVNLGHLATLGVEKMSETERALDGVSQFLARRKQIASADNEAEEGHAVESENHKFDMLENDEDEVDESEDGEFEDPTDEDMNVLESIVNGEDPEDCESCLERQSLGENIACPMCTDDVESEIDDDARREALLARLNAVIEESEALRCTDVETCSKKKKELYDKMRAIRADINALERDMDMLEDSATGGAPELTATIDEPTGGDFGEAGAATGGDFDDKDVDSFDATGPLVSFEDASQGVESIDFLADNIQSDIEAWKTMKERFEKERTIFESLQRRIRSMTMLKQRHLSALRSSAAKSADSHALSSSSLSTTRTVVAASSTKDIVSSLREHASLLNQACSFLDRHAPAESGATGASYMTGSEGDIEEEESDGDLEISATGDEADGEENVLESSSSATGYEARDEEEDVLESATGNDVDVLESATGIETEDEEEDDATKFALPVPGCDGMAPEVSLGCDDCEYAFYRPYETDPFTGEVVKDKAEGEGICVGCLPVEGIPVVPPGEPDSNFDQIEAMGYATWCPTGESSADESGEPNEEDTSGPTGGTTLEEEEEGGATSGSIDDVDVREMSSEDLEELSDDDLMSLLSRGSFFETSEAVSRTGEILRRLRGVARDAY
eukprot:g5021.t1